MVGELARRVLVPLVADYVRQVLDEVAAPRDVQHLRAAADGQDGHVPLERTGEERDLEVVALGPRRIGCRVRFGAVERGVEVRPARDDQRVEEVQEPVRVALAAAAARPGARPRARPRRRTTTG